MRVAIMQPYFLPYIGYFQLIGAVDLFVVYDNIKYTKKGWINRNRMLCNGKDVLFSLPVMNGADEDEIRERRLAKDFDRAKLLNRIRENYRKAPEIKDAFPCIQKVIQYDDDNLFRFVEHSIVSVCNHLRIDTELRMSSLIATDENLKGSERVIAICQEVGATTYINAIGGLDLYSKQEFQKRGIELRFLKSSPFEYTQFDRPFVPSLSILDVMMFNSLSLVQHRLVSGFELI